VVRRQRWLELQFGEVVAAQQRLQQNLREERQRSQELSQALADAREQLEQAVGRLSEEARTGRELQTRLAGIQQEMNQLQGELALVLQSRSAGETEGSTPVQLERIVVRDAAAPGLQGRVVSVHRDWNFVIIDLGWDAVSVGDTVSIFRDNQLLAQARIERVQEGVCAATLLPQWAAANVDVDDLVRVL